MEPTKNNGATDVAAPTAPRTEPNKASVPENGDGRKCQMPGCENLATDGGIHCVQHQPALLATSWQERLAAFPAELRDKDIWCVWRPEERDSKLTKVPCAKSNDPATWVSFKEACAIADRNEGYGVGVFCDGSHSFVDLDKCIVNGEIEAWAQAVLVRANSYAELSPSGTGLHIFLKGAVSKAAKINGCEIYSRARFFTVTGKHIPTTPLTIAEPTSDELEELRQDIADGVLRPKADDKPAEGPSGGVTIYKAMTQAEREEKLQRALSGDISEYGDDRSAAVHGALQLLARKHQGDPEAIAEEFEASELCGMWGHKWDRLRDNEIAKAIERWEENGKPAWDTEDRQPWKLVRFSSIQAKPIAWIWKRYLAKGKLTMLNGEPSHGKSLVSLDIAARLSCQKVWPDGTTNEIPPSSVLLLTEEEDAEDTIKPRFLAAGGDPAKLIALAMGAELFRVEFHTERLRKMIEQQAPDTQLIILDPVADYTTVDTAKDSEVRPMLNKLVRLASDLDIAVLGINHLNKKTDQAAMHRVAGARGFTAVARLNFLVGKDAEGLRHLVPLKVNVTSDSGSLDFKVRSADAVDGKITVSQVPLIEWLGQGTTTADQLLAVHAERKQGDGVELWLRSKLASGEWTPSAPIAAEAAVAGISEDRLGRARKKIGVEHRRTGMPARTEWRLPQAPAPITDHDLPGFGEVADAV